MKRSKLLAVVVDPDTYCNVRLSQITMQTDLNCVFIKTVREASEYFSNGLDPDVILLPWDNDTKEQSRLLIESLKIRGFRTPIVLLTKRGTIETEEYILCHERAFELGAVAVIDKPYDTKKVMRQLKAVSHIANSKKRAEREYTQTPSLFHKLTERLA